MDPLADREMSKGLQKAASAIMRKIRGEPGTEYTARRGVPKDKYGFTVVPALQPPVSILSESLPPLAQTRRLKPLEDTFTAGESVEQAFDAEEASDSESAEEHSSEDEQTTEEGKVEETSTVTETPPETTMENETTTCSQPPEESQEESGPVVSADTIEQLLVSSRTLMTANRKKFARIFSRAERTEDGSIGIHIFTMQFSMDSTEKDTVPKFLCTTFSCFTTIDRSILGKSLQDWLEFTIEMDESCRQDPALIAEVRQVMNSTVRKYTKDVSYFLEMIKEVYARDTSYDYATVVANWFSKFLGEIQCKVSETVDKYMRQARGKKALSLMTGSSTEEKALQDAAGAFFF